MAFSGGIFSRIYNWVSDKNNSIPITASRMDAEMDGMATGLSTCVLKDGSQTIIADIPMSSHKFTGLSAGSASTDSATIGQVQQDALKWCGTSGGTANAQTLTPSPVITAYAAGQEFDFLPVATNTSGTVTIANSGLATRAIKKSIGGALVVLAVGDIVIGVATKVKDDGTQYVLLNPQTYTHGADIASATTTVLDTTTGDLVDLTGTTTITAITLAEGRQVTVRHTGVHLLTNGASLVLLSGANITTVAGDISVFRGYASGVVRQISFQRLSGRPLVTQATRQVLTSGSGATYTTPTNCIRLNIRQVGAGGGGGGNGSSGASNGGAGVDTTFNSIVAKGGSGGILNAGTAGVAGGAGGTGGTGTADVRISGGNGAASSATNASYAGAAGGDGAASAFGGAGLAGSAGKTNTGGGGSGATVASTTIGPAGGGGAGEYTEFLILNPSATYTYTVGTIGTAGGAGVGGGAGLAGGSGLIIVDEYYV